jgi:hypothetical protein
LLGAGCIENLNVTRGDKPLRGGIELGTVALNQFIAKMQLDGILGYQQSGVRIEVDARGRNVEFRWRVRRGDAHADNQQSDDSSHAGPPKRKMAA